jgi:hypothetical protein
MNGMIRGIEFTVLVADGFGIALWQADGTGPEPAATGHRFITAVEPITAHYYVASRDYVDISARGGVCASGMIGEWPMFQAALAAARRKLSDLVLRLPLTTPGPDREGEDWFFSDGVETRFLRPQAPLPLSLQGSALLEFAPSRLVLTEDYRGARHFADVRISLVSEVAPARATSSVGDGPFAQVAAGLLADFAGRPVRLAVDSISLSPTRFAGNGRTSGRFAEIVSARLEVA